MFGYVKFIGWAAAFTSSTFGVMISLAALGLLIGGQSGDEVVILNGIVGVVLGMRFLDLWMVGMRNTLKENDK